jgi:hypothetical protein
MLRLRSEHDRRLRRQPAAAAVRDRDLGAGTCESPASPRSWRVASHSRNSPRIPGWVADKPPPSVFVGSAPPSAGCRRRRSRTAAFPFGANPRSSSTTSTVYVNESYIANMSTSAGVIPASANAFGPLNAAAVTVMSDMPWIEWCVVPPAAPRTYTGLCGRSRARSSVVRMMQHPPSEITQQSSLCTDPRRASSRARRRS